MLPVQVKIKLSGKSHQLCRAMDVLLLFEGGKIYNKHVPLRKISRLVFEANAKLLSILYMFKGKVHVGQDVFIVDASPKNSS